MGEQLTAHAGGRAHGGAGGEILGGDGPRKPHEGQQHQHPAELPDEGGVSPSDALIDDGGNDKGHAEVKAGLQQLEQGGQYAFLGVHTKAAQENFHRYAPVVKFFLT